MMTNKVYQAIAGVAAEMAVEGISKDRNNQQQGYKFRGIDDVYNALAPVISKHKLCILPRMVSRDCVERTNAKGTALFYVTVEAEFDFVSAEDGSKHTVRTFGEAMDSGDKATNKAMSAAYKYAAMQAFCIPTEGDNDADATTHDVAPKTKAPAPKPDNYDAMLKDLRKCTSKEDVTRWWKDDEVKAVWSKWPEEWGHALRDACAAHGRSLQSQDTVEAIKNQFGGASVVNEHVREQSYLEAGE